MVKWNQRGSTVKVVAAKLESYSTQKKKNKKKI
jgi:hypothetical protein